MPEPKDTSFRISSDPSVSISAEEVEAQSASALRLQQIREQEGKLRHLNDMDVHDSATKIGRYRHAGVQADDVRAGNNPHIRMPDAESQQNAIDAGDLETAHLYHLQGQKPGTPEFMSKAPAGEEVIEIFGHKGAEGFGVVKRVVGTGPGAGITEIT